MLYLNASEEKRLTFEVDIQGIESKELQGYVRFMLYGVEYGFPVEIEHKKITAHIPPLIKIVEREIEDGSVINAKLEVFTDKNYFKPWEGEIRVGAPMGVKAKLSDDPKLNLEVKTKLLTPQEAKEEDVEEKTTKDDIKKVIGEVLKEMMGKKKNDSVIEENKKEQLVKEKLDKYRSDKIIDTELKSSKKGLTKEDMKNNITEDFIYRYMAKVGSKKKKIQEIIYNKAIQAAGTGEPYEVLKEVVKIFGKKKNFKAR